MDEGRDTQKTLRETLRDAMRAKGISVQKLVELTDIPLHYVQALAENDTENLPPAPYVRGYLMTIADALDTDGEALWRQYKHDERLRRSGGEDTLPSNRFAHAKPNKKIIIATIVVLAALAYLIPSIANFFGKPGIALTAPATDGQVVTQNNYAIAGHIDNPQDKLLINNEEVVVGADGNFQKEVLLQPGQNTYTIVVHRFLGRDTTLTRTIWLQTTATTTQPLFYSTSTAPTTSSGTAPAGL